MSPRSEHLQNLQKWLFLGSVPFPLKVGRAVFMELKGRNEREGCFGMKRVETSVQKPCAALCLWESVPKLSFSRAKEQNLSMVACSIEHFGAIKESLGKRTRGIWQWHGHAWRVKRVFDYMAMPPNDDHFEERDLFDFLDFSHFACLEISCAEVVRAND